MLRKKYVAKTCLQAFFFFFFLAVLCGAAQGDRLPVAGSVIILDISVKAGGATIDKASVTSGVTKDHATAGKKAPRKGQGLLPLLVIYDAQEKVLYEKEFSYPEAITVPPLPEGASDPGTPDQIAITEPRISLVLPYFDEAASARVIMPGRSVSSPAVPIEPGPSVKSRSGTPMAEPAPAEYGKFHLLIMASGYTSASMASFTSRASEVRQLILSKEPFATYSAGISIHIYSNTASVGCYNGCAGVARLLCCSSSEVIAAATASGYLFDEIIIIHNTSTYSGGGMVGGSYKTNSYSTYCAAYGGSGTASYPKYVALHEFGHSFGGLCDEYSYTSEGIGHTQCVNCRMSCSVWGSLAGACNQGCSAMPTYYRPEKSIMYDYTNTDFNRVSRKSTLSPDGLEVRLQYFIGGVPDEPAPIPLWDNRGAFVFALCAAALLVLFLRKRMKGIYEKESIKLLELVRKKKG